MIHQGLTRSVPQAAFARLEVPRLRPETAAAVGQFAGRCGQCRHRPHYIFAGVVILKLLLQRKGHMRLQVFLKASFLLLSFILLTGTAFANAISVNGTCEVGSCASPEIQAANTTTINPFNFSYTFGNSDQYQLQGTVVSTSTVSASTFLATESVNNFIVTYLGNGSGGNSAADTLTIDFLQTFQNSLTGTGTYFEGISGTFGGSLGNATSATGQFIHDGQALPVEGPFSPPPATFSDFVSNVPGTFSGNSLFDARFTLTFGSASAVGSSITINNSPAPVATPEPSTYSLLAGGLSLLFLTKARRKLSTIVRLRRAATHAHSA